MRHELFCIALVAVFAVACGTEDGNSNNEGGSGGSGGVGGTGGVGGGGVGGTGGVGGSGGEVPCTIPDGEVIEAPEAIWTWVPIEGNICRDGSATGIGVYLNPAATRVVIYLEGGGACFNSLSCAQNPASFGQAAFEGRTFSGIIDPADERNPLADSSFVYVPYCTGDVHGGSAEGIDIIRGPQDQSFVGHDNIGRALQRIAPTFAEMDQVVLTGTSAGGFGTLLNFEQVSTAFCAEDVVLLDDSGLPQPEPYLAACLQKTWRDLWNLDETLPAGCEECNQEDGGGIVNFVGFLADSYPDARFGLISSTRDETIGQFFAFGLDDCAQLNAGFPQTSRGIDTFEEGLGELRTQQLEGLVNVSSYFITGGQHTWTARESFFETAVDEQALTDWVSELVAGPLPAPVGP